MSLGWRLLAVMALGVLPMTVGLAAAASSSAPSSASSGTHGGHKSTPKAGTGPARATESPGPGAPTHGQSTIMPGKSSPKLPSASRTLNGHGQGLNGPTTKGSGIGPQGDLSARGTGSPHGTITSSGAPGVRTLQRGGTNPLGAAPSIGSGSPRRPGELNGSTMGARGSTAAKIAPSAKANSSINGTGLGRRN